MEVDYEGSNAFFAPSRVKKFTILHHVLEILLENYPSDIFQVLRIKEKVPTIFIWQYCINIALNTVVVVMVVASHQLF